MKILVSRSHKKADGLPRRLLKIRGSARYSTPAASYTLTFMDASRRTVAAVRLLRL